MGATGESGTTSKWCILKTHTCIIIVTEIICKTSLKALSVTLNIRFVSKFWGRLIFMPHKLHWRNFYVYLVNQCLMALKVSQLSDHQQKGLFENVYVKLFRTSDLNYQWKCTSCFRGVHGINEEMSNVVVDFQDRTDIFLALSSSCLSFLSQPTCECWADG